MTRTSEVARLSGLLMRQALFKSASSSSSSGSAAVATGLRFKSVVVHEKDGKVLHPELINEQVLKTQYAVRGELYLRAEELRKAGKEIIFTNGAHPMHALVLAMRCFASFALYGPGTTGQ